MTAWIRADCPTCGPVETPVAQVRLRLTMTDTASRTAVDFSCPACGTPVTKVLGARATRLLLNAGVAIVGSPSESTQPSGIRRIRRH